MSRLQSLQVRFHDVLTRIETHAQIFFRWIRCWHTRQDKIQEVRSLAWKWIRSLHKAGKTWWAYISRLADYACRAVKCGRKVAGMISAHDVLNEINQCRKGFAVGKLSDYETLSDNPLTDALIDNTQTPVDEQVCFRLDFPRFRNAYQPRQRQIMDALALGHRTQDVARQFRLSECRISQMRREFMNDWSRFCGSGDN